MIQPELIEIILYVNNQQDSARFYKKLFRKEPDIDVPGMTEFNLLPSCKLGLMPGKGMAKILGKNLPHPDEGMGIPRCELYIVVGDAQFEFDHACKMGAMLVSPLLNRDWGHKACYFSDPDGHIIAFAEKIPN